MHALTHRLPTLCRAGPHGLAGGAALVLAAARFGVGALSFTGRLATAALIKSLFSRRWPFIRALALAALPVPWSPVGRLAMLAAAAPAPLALLLAPVGAAAALLRAFSVPVAAMAVTAPICNAVAPVPWRTVRLWRRLLPIYFGYMLTRFNTAPKRHLPAEVVQARWDARHEWGGAKVYDLVVEMSGYFVKSAQILGSKVRARRGR